jgi:hypothetical protein
VELDLAGSELQVFRRVERLNPDYIKQMQIKSITKFAWDQNYSSELIELTADNRSTFLSEDTYLFRSVLSDTGFDSGLHYWELIPDSRSENEMKIGVSKNREFDLKTSFSDYSFGWAFYAIGQLRHCDAANGP